MRRKVRERWRSLRATWPIRFQMTQVVSGCDVVFHLAALIGIPYSYVAPASYVQTNVLGTLNLAEAAVKAKVRRFIHTSTSETYGTAQYTPMDEQHPLQAQSPYSATKISADKLVESFACSFGLPAVTVRPFNTYGPRQSARAVIPTIISQALNGKVIRLGALDPCAISPMPAIRRPDSSRQQGPGRGETGW